MQARSKGADFLFTNFKWPGPEAPKATPVEDAHSEIHIDSSKQLTNLQNVPFWPVSIGERTTTVLSADPERMVLPAHQSLSDRQSTVIERGNEQIPTCVEAFRESLPPDGKPGSSSTEESKRYIGTKGKGGNLILKLLKGVEGESAEVPSTSMTTADTDEERQFSKDESAKHEQSTSQQKPHTCKQCGNSYALQASLTRHMRRHGGIRPYVCKHQDDPSQDPCGSSFYSNHELKHHKLIHGDKSFACTLCDKTFSQPTGLRLHMQRVHSSSLKA